MNYGKLRNGMLGLAPLLLLGACGSSDHAATSVAAPTTASPQGGDASTVAAPVAASPAPAGTGPAEAAVRGIIDPVTGQIRAPTPAELQALEAGKQTSAPKSAINTKPAPKETVTPSGWVAVELNADSEMKGCMQKDGRVVAAHECKSVPPAAGTKP